ncbi:glycosyltransferase [Acidimangrovimonas pyrenivorans]|uniref:Glycosyltransferase n=1 Tax=Acidimangrovimonas pyrenivorans TaxID=2030798 RepID=A0ABV7AHN0_9RHOB
MTASPPRVSVIVPLYNDADTIAATLDALDAQSGAPDFEVIVVDDGSTDGGDSIAAGRAQVIRQRNAGPAAARNAGAARARGALLLFLDADCTPPANWVAALAGAIDGTGFDAVMGTLRAANDGVVPRLVQLEIEDRYRGMSAAKEGVDFIAAPSCGVVRSAFQALGGFDAGLRQAEDVDLAYRLASRGHRIAFVETAPVAHAHQRSWGQFIATKYRRAVGRLEVYGRHPHKRRHDHWTPMSLKAQFGLIALSLPLLVLALFRGMPEALLAALSLLGGLALGLPLIRDTARREAPLVGLGAGLLVGAGFVIIRSLVILAAMIRIRLRAVARLAGAAR